MPNDGSMDVLPISPCTSGSLGIDSHFSSTTPLKVVENLSAVCLATKAEATHLDDNDLEDKEEKVVEDKKEETEETTDKKEETEETTNDVREHHTETGVAVVSTVSTVVDDNETTKEDPVDALTEKTATTSLSSTNPSAATTENQEEKMASGVSARAVLSGMPTHAQSRVLSAASLALKKKQAAQNAEHVLKSVAVEIPEIDSISNRIKIFGGANTSRTGGYRKFNVKDMIQKYKDVEEQSQEQIAHVTRGHSANEPKGVCAAYSLSTASRPTNALRPTPRRKMSHELSENEVRNITCRGSSDEDRMGVSQESVQSVRNAKSLFENLGRAESAGAQL